MRILCLTERTYEYFFWFSFCFFFSVRCSTFLNSFGLCWIFTCSRFRKNISSIKRAESGTYVQKRLPISDVIPEEFHRDTNRHPSLRFICSLVGINQGQFCDAINQLSTANGVSHVSSCFLHPRFTACLRLRVSVQTARLMSILFIAIFTYVHT